jgi:hypothetical protein
MPFFCFTIGRWRGLMLLLSAHLCWVLRARQRAGWLTKSMSRCAVACNLRQICCHLVDLPPLFCHVPRRSFTRCHSPGRHIWLRVASMSELKLKRKSFLEIAMHDGDHRIQSNVRSFENELPPACDSARDTSRRCSKRVCPCRVINSTVVRSRFSWLRYCTLGPSDGFVCDGPDCQPFLSRCLRKQLCAPAAPHACSARGAAPCCSA